MEWPERLRELADKAVEFVKKVTPERVTRHTIKAVLGDLTEPGNTLGHKLHTLFEKIKTLPEYPRMRLALLDHPQLDAPEDWHFNKKNGAALKPEDVKEKNPIIYFGGSGTVRDFPHFAGILQEIRQLIEMENRPEIAKEFNARVIAYGYEGTTHWTDQDKRIAEETRLNLNPEYYNPEAKIFMEKFLLPKVFKEVQKNDDGSFARNEQGNVKVEGLLSTRQLEKNLRMTMIGDSYGGAFIRQVMNVLSMYMLENGYTKDEAHAGMRNIYVDSTGSSAPFKRDIPCATAIRKIHVGDTETLLEVNTRGYYPNSEQEKEKRLDPQDPYIVKIAPNQLLVWIVQKMDKLGKKGYHEYDRTATPQIAVNALRYAVLCNEPLPEIGVMATTEYKARESLGTDRHGDNIYREHIDSVVAESAIAREALKELRQVTLEGNSENIKAALRNTDKAVREAILQAFPAEGEYKGISGTASKNLAKKIARDHSRQFVQEAEAIRASSYGMDTLGKPIVLEEVYMVISEQTSENELLRDSIASLQKAVVENNWDSVAGTYGMAHALICHTLLGKYGENAQVAKLADAILIPLKVVFEAEAAKEVTPGDLSALSIGELLKRKSSMARGGSSEGSPAE